MNINTLIIICLNNNIENTLPLNISLNYFSCSYLKCIHFKSKHE